MSDQPYICSRTLILTLSLSLILPTPAPGNRATKPVRPTPPRWTMRWLGLPWRASLTFYLNLNPEANPNPFPNRSPPNRATKRVRPTPPRWKTPWRPPRHASHRTRVRATHRDRVQTRLTRGPLGSGSSSDCWSSPEAQLTPSSTTSGALGRKGGEVLNPSLLNLTLLPPPSLLKPP